MRFVRRDRRVVVRSRGSVKYVDDVDKPAERVRAAPMNSRCLSSILVFMHGIMELTFINTIFAFRFCGQE